MKKALNSIGVDFSNIIKYLTLLRISIKFFIFFAAFYYHFPLEQLSILLLVLILTEIYKNAGTLWIEKGGSRFFIGSAVSVMDGIVIIWLLNGFHLINTDVYLYILLSILFN